MALGIVSNVVWWSLACMMPVKLWELSIMQLASYATNVAAVWSLGLSTTCPDSFIARYNQWLNFHPRVLMYQFQTDFKAGGFFDRDQSHLDSCSVCQKPIVEATLMALKRRYHRNCFRCSVCNRSLADDQFCPSPNDPCAPLCLDDYWRMVAPICSHCTKPILPSAKAAESNALVVAKTLHRVDHSNGHHYETCSYHPQCVPTVAMAKWEWNFHPGLELVFLSILLCQYLV